MTTARRLIHHIQETFSKEKTDNLLAGIREGKSMTTGDKANLIAQLAIPSILAQVTHILMFFIDAAMVGHLGAGPSAAIGLVESTTWLLGSLTGAISTGFSVQIAHAVGANDMERARTIFRHALICAITASLMILILGVSCAGHLPYWLGGTDEIAHDASLYFMIWVMAMPIFQIANLCGASLKSSGDMRTPSTGSIMMCILDVVFNYLFIFQFDMGVCGAAIGTALAIFFNASFQAYNAAFRNSILAFRHMQERFRWNSKIITNAIKISLPMALQSFLLSGAQIVSTMIVAPLGVIAIASNTFSITAESLCYMPGYGIGDAATTLVGQSTGARRKDLCWSFAIMSVSGAMMVMALMGVIMYVFAPEMIALLSPIPEIQALGTEVLRIEAWAEPMFAASIVCYSCMVGAGDTIRPAAINLASMWCVRLSLAYFLAKDYGLCGVWTAMAIELSVRGTLFLIRLCKKNWIKN